MKKYSKSMKLAISIIILNTIWAFSSASIGFQMVEGYNYIQNFLSVFSIGLVLATVIFIVDVKKIKTLENDKDSKGKIKIKVAYNLLYFALILVAGYIYSRVSYGVTNDDIFYSMKNYSMLCVAILVFVGIGTYIYERIKKNN